MSKKWYENIPKNGVLCKVAGDDAQFVHIRDTHDLAEFCCDYEVDETVLTPITPSEWWQFAPWQSIKTISFGVPVLLRHKNGLIKTATIPDPKILELTKWVEWLPLPEENTK